MGRTREARTGPRGKVTDLAAIRLIGAILGQGRLERMRDTRQRNHSCAAFAALTTVLTFDVTCARGVIQVRQSVTAHVRDPEVVERYEQ
jgi:hypothetical protein